MARLTVKEAAAYVRCHPGTLNKLRMKGRGPRYTKPIARVFYDTEDLDVWINASKRQSTAAHQPKLVRPWEDEGVSERTWYRRRAQK